MTISTWYPVSNEIAAITNGDPGVVTTVTPHGYLTGLYVRLNILGFGMSQANGNVYLITVLSETTFSIRVNTLFFDPFIPTQSLPITAITNADPVVITVGANSFYPGELVILEGIVGMTFVRDGFTFSLNNKIVQLKTVTSTTISFNLDTADYNAYVSGGTVSTIEVPQVIPVGEVALSLLQAEKNVSAGPEF